jgi:Sulfotransferase domain
MPNTVTADRDAARPQLLRRDADVYFLSYPKAGRTWLRALVGKALVDHYALPESQLLDTQGLTRAARLPIAVFDHDDSGLRQCLRWQDMNADRTAYRGRKVLLMVRDIRDNLVSAYFQASRRINVFDGPLSAFIRHDAFGVDKILAFYRIWSASRQVPAAFEFLSYEDLHRDTAGTLARALAFLGSDVSAATIAAAVEYCRFENLRKAEAEDRFNTDVLRSARDGDPEAFKVRKGKVGNYTEYLSPEDIAYIDTAVAARGSGGSDFFPSTDAAA